jgi:hypothetical protein
MPFGNSTAIFTALAALAVAVLLPGCASVASTSQYYMPYTAKYYPPKAAKTYIPILGKFPPERHAVIGRLRFETDQGWGFLRKSMIYNAQMNGADAVVLKTVNTREQTSLIEVPPQVDWVPNTYYYRDRKGRQYSQTNWVPFFQPGYVRPVVSTITGIDSEMIVFKR